MFTTHTHTPLMLLAASATLLTAPTAFAQSGATAPKLTTFSELNLREGESMSFSAAQVMRVGIEHSAILRAGADAKANTLSFTGVKPGLTTLTLTAQDASRHTLYVRVAPATPEPVIAAAMRDGTITISARCLTLAARDAPYITMRLTLSSGGEVIGASAESAKPLSAPVRQCLRDDAKKWRFQVQPESPFSVALIPLSTAE